MLKLSSIMLVLWAGFTLGSGEAYAAGLGVEKAPFGKMPDGVPVEKYTLTNTHGMVVTIITYGATVQSIQVPDKDGKVTDVALGFAT